MTTYNAVIEGQTFPLPEEIAATDDGVKRALAPFYPDAANALITRVQKDDVVMITVVKRAGTKGATILDLANCTGGRNPAIELDEEIRRRELQGNYTPLELVELEPRIDQAILDGEAQAKLIEQAGKRLMLSAPRPAPDLITGF
jgi:hypothetical protein